MTLPAHRYLDRAEERAKGGDDPKVWTFDFDENITTAPKRLARIAAALKAMGDRIVVVTGNQAPREELVDRLTNDYGFPFDDLIQYEDDQTDGMRRAAILKELDAWGAFDNRMDRGYTYAKVCPHFFLLAKPNKDAEANTKGAKQDAKSAVKNAVKGVSS